MLDCTALSLCCLLQDARCQRRRTAQDTPQFARWGGAGGGPAGSAKCVLHVQQHIRPHVLVNAAEQVWAGYSGLTTALLRRLETKSSICLKCP